MVLNKKLEAPFTKVPPEGGNLDVLQPTEVKAVLSNKVKNALARRDRSEEKRREKFSSQIDYMTP